MTIPSNFSAKNHCILGEDIKINKFCAGEDTMINTFCASKDTMINTSFGAEIGHIDASRSKRPSAN